jgi:nucleoside-diphosphate-sugar epimerase
MEIIGNAMGKTDLIQFGTVQKRDWEPEFICGDNQKLRQLGWQPRYGLQDGLVETIKWWQNA